MSVWEGKIHIFKMRRVYCMCAHGHVHIFITTPVTDGVLWLMMWWMKCILQL